MGVQEYINVISTWGLEEYFSRFGEIELTLQLEKKRLLELEEREREEELEELERQVRKVPTWVKIHILSFCMKVSADSRWVITLLEEVLAADYEVVGEYNKLSHYWQTTSYIFTNPKSDSPKARKMLAQLYYILKQSFCDALGIKKREYIPLEDRNKELVFVFSGQVQGMLHAPTKTLLDRCYVLQKYLHKKVYIVNTAMVMPQKGQAPFFELQNTGYDENLLQLGGVQYQEEVFSFFQCENKMPDLEIMQFLLEKIRDLKPCCLIHIGGNDICADLCGMLVPQITISTVFSKIAISGGEYQMVDRALTEEDLDVLQILKVQSEKVKRTMFTFSFKEQEHHYFRKDLNLWDDRFVLAVIGWRLEEEVDETFLEMLCKVLADRESVSVAFIGGFQGYEKVMESYPKLQQSCRYLGRQQDVLAVLECCDLYVNPKRNGGGSSVSEALFKGVPAVTLPMGDVSVAAGEEFWVQNYDQMARVIIRYMEEPEFYEAMRVKAKMRAALLTDSARSFGETIKEIWTEMGISVEEGKREE